MLQCTACGFFLEESRQIFRVSTHEENNIQICQMFCLKSVSVCMSILHVSYYFIYVVNVQHDLLLHCTEILALSLFK